jgi:signal transduction histidine kinase
MRHVADTGRGALTEMRRLLGVLAEPGDVSPRAPQPSADDLTALVERFRETGLPVRLSTSGPPLSDPGLALTVHRIVQESLTNVLRHAPAADRVEVSVAREGGDVTVTVDDDAVVHATPLTTGAGRGLIGMRERALVYGGSVDAGPRPGGGWRVRVVLHGTGAHGEDEG